MGIHLKKLSFMQDPFYIDKSMCPTYSLTHLSRSPGFISILHEGSHIQRLKEPRAISHICMNVDKEGFRVPQKELVGIFWDLDSNPPRGAPYRAAMNLKKMSQEFGRLIETSAYAYPKTFFRLPNWAHHELDRHGRVTGPQPHVCGLCGLQCTTEMELRGHFSDVHKPENVRKTSVVRAVKGVRRKHCRNNFMTWDAGYMERCGEMISPKIGYYLLLELKEAKFSIKNVKSIPLAAELTLKKLRRRGIGCVVVVSDNSDLYLMLRNAKEYGVTTVVVGDVEEALSAYADFWIPWIGVEAGEGVTMGSVPRCRREAAVRKIDNFH